MQCLVRHVLPEHSCSPNSTSPSPNPLSSAYDRGFQHLQFHDMKVSSRPISKCCVHNSSRSFTSRVTQESPLPPLLRSLRDFCPDPGNSAQGSLFHTALSTPTFGNLRGVAFCFLQTDQLIQGLFPAPFSFLSRELPPVCLLHVPKAGHTQSSREEMRGPKA